jgi:hypothetical protein
VQFYWRLSGLEHSASNYYVRYQRDELAWIPRVARACGVVAPPLPDGAFDAVHALWATRQAEYYARACARAQRDLRWRHVGSGALGASLVISFALVGRVSMVSSWLRLLLVPVGLLLVVHLNMLFSEFLSREDAGSERDSRRWNLAARIAGFAASLGMALLLVNVPRWVPLRFIPRWVPSEAPQWLFLSLGVAALVGGLLHAYSQVRAFAEHARRYGNLAAIFQRGAERLRTALDGDFIDRTRALIVELGKESLNDHGDWVILHRERPIELPEGGA